ncbi:MAG: hypothetical protein H6557_33645 [Lewinellaceae bacterium]|nr:hypothetical protein [Phaeodactylibacter sp.]MCB9041584.1 hypothetical protein [Lewinellaceae bacterium]
MSQNTFYLLLILILIVLTGGILFYLNTIVKTLRDCCNKPGTLGTDSCNITYPADSIGADSPNLLSYADGATANLGQEGIFPLRADLSGPDCMVKVLIKTNDPNIQLGLYPNQHNWFARGVNEGDSHELTYFTYGAGVADGNFNLQGSGTAVIEVYENGNVTPVKIINFQLG